MKWNAHPFACWPPKSHACLPACMTASIKEGFGIGLEQHT